MDSITAKPLAVLATVTGSLACCRDDDRHQPRLDALLGFGREILWDSKGCHYRLKMSLYCRRFSWGGLSDEEDRSDPSW
jgi:hypothetical protein